MVDEEGEPPELLGDAGDDAWEEEESGEEDARFGTS